MYTDAARGDACCLLAAHVPCTRAGNRHAACLCGYYLRASALRCSTLQILRYGLGQKYGAHWDSIQREVCALLRSGARAPAVVVASFVI